MLEIFDLYFGFEVPWWNSAVTSPSLKLPKTIQYLADNFDGEEYDFRRSQIMRGLKKGRDELTKMTTRYLLKVPIMFILLTHREHGLFFLCSVLAILRDNPLDDLEVLDMLDTVWLPAEIPLVPAGT